MCAETHVWPDLIFFRFSGQGYSTERLKMERKRKRIGRLQRDAFVQVLLLAALFSFQTARELAAEVRRENKKVCRQAHSLTYEAVMRHF
jgi:hypothetical protein